MRVFLLLVALCGVALAAEVTIPTVDLRLSAPQSPRQLVTVLNVVVVLTILALAPTIVFVMTSFLRLVWSIKSLKGRAERSKACS